MGLIQQTWEMLVYSVQCNYSEMFSPHACFLPVEGQ